MVGGQPELGKTTYWTDSYRAQSELHKPDLRFTPTEATQLARLLGLTHAATGSVSGNAPRMTLTYRLLAVPGGKSIVEAKTCRSIDSVREERDTERPEVWFRSWRAMTSSARNS